MAMNVVQTRQHVKDASLSYDVLYIDRVRYTLDSPSPPPSGYSTGTATTPQQEPIKRISCNRKEKRSKGMQREAAPLYLMEHLWSLK
ncbi:hypothetical protein DPMN_120283 [Dreissena polymorpha]|uniref:Uncharacterized protein n=1 Tax=Dreissena polymorpha TaxID=45954 RepID=A0A9D4GKK2_DREPO|nr:hypothetical protein DPMN_120283 [Dreissena polymorpha]